MGSLEGPFGKTGKFGKFNVGSDSRADRDLQVEAHKMILMIIQRVLVELWWRVVCQLAPELVRA